MTKRRGRSQRPAREDELTPRPFHWIPLWGWALIFPLSEPMFWNVGRTHSMILFPIAWTGFWYVMMQRSGWPILKNRKRIREEPTAEEDS